jgi:hypothetical protein
MCADDVHTFRPGTGLAEQLAPDLLACPQRPQPALLLLGRAVRQNGGRGHAKTDSVPLRVIARTPRLGESAIHNALQGTG